MLGSRRGSPSTPDAGRRPPAVQPSHLTNIDAAGRGKSSNLLETLAEKWGFVKPKPVDLSVEQQKAIRDIDAELESLEKEKTIIKDRIRVGLKLNTAYQISPADTIRLNAINLKTKKLTGYLGTIIKQEMHIKQQRMDMRLLDVIDRGNQTYKTEGKQREKIDYDDILGEVEEMDEEAIADQIEIYERLDGVATRDNISDLEIGNSGQTMGSIVDAEIEELRREARAEQESDALDVKSDMPSMFSMPVLSGRAPQTTPTAVSNNIQRQPIALSSGYSANNQPAPKAPYYQAVSTPSASLNFSDELNWLQ